DVGRRAARNNASEPRFRRRKTKCLGEDLRWRPRPRTQGVQCQNEARCLRIAILAAAAWPNADNNRQFILALNYDRLGDQRIEAGRCAKAVNGFLEQRPRSCIAQINASVFDADTLVEYRFSGGVCVGDESLFIE